MEDKTDQSAEPEDDSSSVITPGEESVIPELGGYWGEFQREIESLADQHRDEGWEVLEVHPGDVHPIGPSDPERWGLDVVVPDDELSAVEKFVSDSAPTQFELFRSDGNGIVFQLVVAKDLDDKRVILIPTYYRESDVMTLRSAAIDQGVIPIRLRPLTQTPVITFSYEDPALFFGVEE